MSYLMRVSLVAAGALLVAGCWHVRNYAVSDTKDYGMQLKTRYRYHVVASLKAFSDQFEREMPSVFARDGIPITLHTSQEVLPGKSWSYLDGDDFVLFDFLYFCCQMGTCWTILPLHMKGNEQTRAYSIEILELDAPKEQINVCECNDKIAGCLIPIVPFLCYHGNPAPEKFAQGHGFETHEYKLGDSADAASNFKRALAYGVASKLKEMEDAGTINEQTARNAASVRSRLDARQRLREKKIKERQEQDRAQRTYEARSKMLAMEQQRGQAAIGRTLQQNQVENQPAKAPYHIVYLERDGKNDFAYRFAMELNGEPSIQTFFGVQTIFAEEVCTAYQREFPGVDVSALRIAVQPRLVNGRIEGRAEVLTITPISLAYDADTRKGRLSVRFNAGQAEEARAWIRRNIETLVRDKNIVLVTGRQPPAATYYSLGEKIAGDVMEIEFRTE